MLQRGGVDACLAERRERQKGVGGEPCHQLYVRKPKGLQGFPRLGRFDALLCWSSHGLGQRRRQTFGVCR